jgi:hypothetical protein
MKKGERMSNQIDVQYLPGDTVWFWVRDFKTSETKPRKKCPTCGHLETYEQTVWKWNAHSDLVIRVVLSESVLTPSGLLVELDLKDWPSRLMLSEVCGSKEELKKTPKPRNKKEKGTK